MTRVLYHTAAASGPINENDDKNRRIYSMSEMLPGPGFIYKYHGNKFENYHFIELPPRAELSIASITLIKILKYTKLYKLAGCNHHRHRHY